MWKKCPALLVGLALAELLIAPGCATVMRGSKQWIPVTSSPARATVSVNGVRKGVTPLGIGLARGMKNQVIRIEAPGYHPYEIKVERDLSVLHELGNVLMASFIGGVAAWIAFMSDETANNDAVYKIGIPAGILGLCLIDFTVGGVYSFDPTDITVTLAKADGPPRVDVMLIDADDLRNLKWIRIRGD